MRIITLVLVGALYPGFAAATHMNYRNEYRSPQGYNSGTGRFENRERKLVVEFDSISLMQSAGDSSRLRRQFSLEVNAEIFALGLEYTKARNIERLDETSDHFFDASRFGVNVLAYQHLHRLSGWFGGFGLYSAAIDGGTEVRSLSLESGGTKYKDNRLQGSATFGQRWGLLDGRFSVTLGARVNHTFAQRLDSKAEERDQAQKAFDRSSEPILNLGYVPEAYVKFGLMF
jgi:hypothetical protein